MSTKMTEEKKEAAKSALKEGLQDGWEASAGKGLSWWKRALWVLLAGVAAAVSVLLAPSCSVDYSQSAAGDTVFRGYIVLPVDETEK